MWNVAERKKVHWPPKHKPKKKRALCAFELSQKIVFRGQFDETSSENFIKRKLKFNDFLKTHLTDGEEKRGSERYIQRQCDYFAAFLDFSVKILKIFISKGEKASWSRLDVA